MSQTDELFEVEEYTIGAKEGTEHIIFSNMKQMKEASQAFNDGRDIFVKVKDYNGTGPIIIKVPNRMISDRLYKGEIILGSRGE